MINKTSWSSILVLALLVAWFSVLGYPGEVTIITVEDGLGRTVEVPENVERIVGLEAGALRLITYLEATDLVVGVEEFEKRDRKRPYRLAHPELANLQSIGPIHGGDPELIAAARPDVIFWTYTTKGKANDLQNKTGIPVVGLNYGGARTMNWDTFYSTLRLVGKVLNKEGRAEEVVEFIKDEISNLRELGNNAPESSISVYVGGIGQRGARGIVSTEPAYLPFSFLNLNNVAGKLGVEHAFINEEKLLQWDPDYLFVDEAGLSLVKRDLNQSTFKGLSAVRSGKVFGLLPYNYYTTNFGTVLANAYYVGKLIYPKTFEGINPVEKANELYNFLLGERVYPKMEEIFGGFGQIDITS